MAIDIEYENARQQGDPLTRPDGWVSPGNQGNTVQPTVTPQPTIVQPSTDQNLSQGLYIQDEQALQQRRDELSQAGIAESDWGKYISSPTADSSKLYYRQPATLNGPNGEKRKVATGSKEANDLLKAGWTLGDQFNDNIISSSTMMNEKPINIGEDTSSNTFEADTVLGGIKATDTSTEAKINELNQKLIGETPETDESRAYNAILASLDPDSLTGRGEAQLSEEEKRGIEQQKQQYIAKQSELRQKMNEINALGASYEMANASEVEKNTTMFQLRGAQAQNYKMYMAKKNMLTADAAFIQSDLLAMGGQLQASQDAADRAVDLMYSDREAEYNANLAKLEILAPQVEKQEERYLNQIKLDLEEQKAILAEEKATKKDIQSLKLDYIDSMLKAGRTPDSGVLSNLGKSKSLDDAMNIYANNAPKDTKGTPTTKIYTGSNIPIDLKTELINNIANGASKNDVYLSYPDVSTEYINSLYNEESGVTINPPEETTEGEESSGEFTWWKPWTWGN